MYVRPRSHLSIVDGAEPAIAAGNPRHVRGEI